MAKKKRGRPRKRGKRRPQRTKVKGYTRIIAVFNGAAKAHARRVRVKGYFRKKPRKK